MKSISNKVREKAKKLSRSEVYKNANTSSVTITKFLLWEKVEDVIYDHIIAAIWSQVEEGLQK